MARHPLRELPRPHHGPDPLRPLPAEIELYLLDGRLEARPGTGGSFGFSLDDLPVALFYRRLVDGLATLGVEVSVDTAPFDPDDDQPLDKNFSHQTFDGDYARRYWRILLWTGGVFEEFAGRFNGKQSPVHLF